jgi:IPT/TIG domain
MNYYFNTSFMKKLIAGAMGIALIAGCTKSKEFSEDYDIDWPVPVITAFTPEKQTIDQNITITGSKFEKLTRVTVGNPETEASIVSSTATQIIVKVPRTANTGPVTVYTNYNQKGVSEKSLTPQYLDVTVTAWPNRITRTEPFTIKGQNMDMVLEVEVDGKKIPISPKGGAATDQLVVPTTGLTLPNQIVVKITRARAGIVNGTSPSMVVEDPSDFFIPEAPIVLYDFEAGNNPYVNYGGSTATSGFNASGAPKGRDARYLTVQKTGAVAWEGLGEFVYNNPINLSQFHKPHLTFLVNTRGKDGYMQAEIVQNGTKWGVHFKPANSPFDYNLASAGWTWVTVELKTENVEKWGGSGTSFDPKGPISQITFGFKRGNGSSSDYEINIDQLMITDGAQKPFAKCWDFEDNVNPYSGSASSGINLSNIATKSGDRYLTVSLNGAANWNWTGDMAFGGPINLSTLADPYINVWVNTNGKKGYFQFETNQANVKWGGNTNTSEYLFETNGWKLYSFRLKTFPWEKWGGSGTATGFDIKGIMDYFKIGFTTGNVAGAYEVNVDDVFISDGPMF